MVTYKTQNPLEPGCSEKGFFWLNTFRNPYIDDARKSKASKVSAIGHLAGATNFKRRNKS
tara:strand:- start:403 stop:582 length:180 start_codon:yes stop_codon:yes gene_type:complete